MVSTTYGDLVHFAVAFRVFRDVQYVQSLADCTDGRSEFGAASWPIGTDGPGESGL